MAWVRLDEKEVIVFDVDGVIIDTVSLMIQ